MIRLTYDPAYDAFHCAFRLLAIVKASQGKQFELDRLRILDFFYLFPQLILSSEFRWTVPIRKSAKAVMGDIKMSPLYGQLPQSSSLFRNMEGMQEAAVQTLISKRIFDLDQLQHKVSLAVKPIPETLEARIDIVVTQDKSLLEFLTTHLHCLSLYGQNGLKARTGLLEHRYDNV